MPAPQPPRRSLIARARAGRGRRGLAPLLLAAGTACAADAARASVIDLWERDPATGLYRRRVEPGAWSTPARALPRAPRPPHAPEGPVTANWVSPASGNWSNAALWSTNPFAPKNGNPAGTTYHAVIGAGPGTYTVTLDAPVSLDGLTLDAAGATLLHSAGALAITGQFALASGTYRLDGGTLAGGTLVMAGGSFTPTANPQNRFDGVTVSGDWSIPDGGMLRISNGLALGGGTLSVGGTFGNSLLGFDGDQTLSGGTVVLSSLNPLIFPTRMTIEGDSTLTIAPGATVRAGSVTIGESQFTPGQNALVNEGTISADVAGRLLRVVPDAFTNTGVVQAVNGGLLEIASPQWTNAGAINATGSTVTLAGSWSSPGSITMTNSTLNLGGTFATAGMGPFTRTGGEVNIKGLVENTGSTLALNAATGTWRLDGGIIEGGTITQSGGAILQFSPSDQSVLRGVTVPGDLNLLQSGPTTSNSRVRIQDGITLGGTARLGNAASITFEGAQTIPSGAFRLEANNASLHFVGPVTLGPGVVVSNLPPTPPAGPYSHLMSGGTLINQGLIRLTGAARLQMEPDAFTNEGTLEVLSGGFLRVGYNFGGASNTAWSNPGTLRVDNSTLVLGGILDATSGLGTFQRTGGTVGLFGSILNTGSTLTLASALGPLELVGGRIVGGTVNLSPGAGLLFNGVPGFIPDRRGYLDGVTLNGNIALGDGPLNYEPFLGVYNGLDLNGTIALTGQRTALVFFGSQTLEGGTIALESAATSQPPVVGFSADGAPSATFTISPTTTIRGGNASIGNWYPASGETVTLVNQGRIASDIEFVGLSLGAHVLVNQGILEVTNAGSLTVAPNTWINNGLIRVIGGTLNMGSTNNLHSFTLGPGTVFERQGGQVNIQGHLNNTGQNLTLNASTGSWRLTGGSITGGQLSLADGAQLVPAQYGGSTFGGILRGLTLNGTLNQAGGLTILDGFTLNGTMILNGTLNVGGNGSSQTISGGTFRFDETVGSTINMFVPVNATQTFAPGTVVRGPGRIGFPFGVGSSYTTAKVVNQGLISSDIPSRELRLQMGRLENQGTIEAVNGARLAIDYDTTWSNTGLIRAAGGGELTLSGKVKTSEIGDVRNEGGSVFIRGPINNTEAHLTLNAQTGSWELANDGSIKGGQVSQLDGSRLTIAGGAFLDGVTFNQDLWFGSWFGTAGSAVVRNGLSVNGTIHMTFPGNTLNFEGNQTFDDGTIAFETTTGSDTWLMASNGGTLTLGPDAVARGGRATIYTSSAGTVGSVINQGRISADVAGQKISIHTARFQNLGIVEAINGGEIVMVPPPPAPTPNPQFINDGALRIGAGSTTWIGGDYMQGYSARLDITIAGTDPLTQTGRLGVWGTATLDGVLGVALAAGYAPAHGDVFQIFNWPSTVEGRFRTLELPIVSPGLWWDTSGLYSAGVIAVVPSPGPAALLAAGGALLAARRRGRRTEARA